MIPPTVTASGVAPGALTTSAPGGQSWQVGTLLEALTLSSTRDGRVRLQVGNQVLQARTELPLQPNQRLQLRVASAGETVVLRTEQAPTRSERVTVALREALPQQREPLPVVQLAQRAPQNLPQNVQQAITRLLQSLPVAEKLVEAKGLREALRQSGVFMERQLASNQPVARDWKAVLLQLRQQLVSSGQAQGNNAATRPAGNVPSAPLSTPAGTQQGSTAGTTVAAATPVTTTVSSASTTTPAPAATRALPAAPVAAAAPSASATPATPSISAPQAEVIAARNSPAVQTSPPAETVARVTADPLRFVEQLTRQVEGALARVQVNQLSSTPVDSVNPRATWLLDLPVQHGNGDAEVIPVTIEREKRNNDENSGPTWSIGLAFDLGRGGRLQARITLRDGQVYTALHADQVTTRERVLESLPRLQSRLERNEIDVGCVSCSTRPVVRTMVRDSQLLETKA
ncbi:MAG: flagellar hook-length control protein FliK [Gammaproteobacteria bacterium]|nr:flagellar hook-length control protein FliK [Gammaproteobacteria bacterium]